LLLLMFLVFAGSGDNALNGIHDLMKSDPAKARILLLEAAKNAETRARANYLLCLLCNRQNDIEGALAYGKTAAALLKDDSEAQLQYAIAIRNKCGASTFYAMTHGGLYRKTLKRAISLDRHNYAAWYEQIGYYMNAPAIAGGSMDKARSTLKALDELNADAALFMSGMMALDEGQYEKAFELYQLAYAADSGNTSALFGAAWCLFSLKRYPESATRFDAIYADDQGQLQALKNAARARLMGGFALEEALIQFEVVGSQAAGNAKQEADAVYYQARVLQALGRKQEARLAYRRSLKLDSKHKEAKKWLNSL